MAWFSGSTAKRRGSLPSAKSGLDGLDGPSGPPAQERARRGGSRVFPVLVALIALVGVMVGGAAIRTRFFAPPPQGAAMPAYDGPGLVYGGPECPSPPPGFDALHASPATLRSYGLPARPAAGASSADLAAWLDDIHHSLHRICGRGTPAPATTTMATSAAPLGEVAKPTGAARSDSVGHPSLSGASAAGMAGTVAASPLVSVDYRSSQVWAGYEVTNGGYNWVQGQWVTPCYTQPAGAGSRAQQWVGIGGNSGRLWQAGTETDTAHRDVLWYEAFPIEPDQFINTGPVFTCGDTIWVVLDTGSASSCGSSSKSYAKWTDIPQGWYWSVCQTFTPGATSAEWIDERPVCSASPLKPYAFTNIRSTRWSAAQVKSTYNGSAAHPISYYSGTILNFTMEEGGLVLAPASALGSDGMSFTDTWDAAGANHC